MGDYEAVLNKGRNSFLIDQTNLTFSPGLTQSSGFIKQHIGLSSEFDKTINSQNSVGIQKLTNLSKQGDSIKSNIDSVKA